MTRYTLGLVFPLLWTFSLALAAEPGVLFSDLPAERQEQIAAKVAAPPLAQRDNPYSTPMYYLMAKGFSDGINKELVLDSNRPDWQEVLIQDWADLGLTSTHFLTYPAQWDDPNAVKAIEDYLALSRKHGLRVGIRLGGDARFGGIEASGWDVHPKNPKNRIAEYVRWAGRVAKATRGQVDYYVIGDEVNSGSWEEPAEGGKTRSGIKAAEDRRWTPEIYMQVFPKISDAIRAEDPKAKVSMFGMGGLDWSYVDALMKLGYARYADGVAANFGDYSLDQMRSFVAKVKAAAPDFRIYSNGVGYVGSASAVAYPSNHGPVYPDDEHAARVAKVMLRAFDAGWDAAPYYIIMRQWHLPDGTIVPHWYGFFGFEDLVLDKDQKLTVKHLPAWYAVQTVANVFHSRSKTQPAGFAVECSGTVDQHLAYERNGYECLIVLWNDKSPAGKSTVTLPAQKYAYPVKVSLKDYRSVTSLPWRREEGGKLVIPDVEVSAEPTIIRLVAEQ